MSKPLIRSFSIAARAVMVGAGAAAAPREKPKVLRLPAAPPRQPGTTPEQRGDKLGMGLGVLIGGVAVVGYWVLKSRRDD